MNFKSRTFLFSIAWVATLAVGVLVGRKSSSTQEAPESEALNRFYERSGNAGSNSDGGGGSERRGSGASRATDGDKISLRGSTTERVEQAVNYLTDISALSDPIERNRQLIQLIDQMDASQYQGVIERFREDGLADSNQSAYSMLLHGWVKQDPVAAIDYVANSDSEDWAKETVIGAWATADPASAAEMVNSLEDGGDINNWIVGLARGIARTDPAAAMLTLQELPISRTRGAAISNVLPAVAEKGTEYALAWLESVKDDSLRRFSAGNLAGQLTDRDPVAASKWASQISDSETRRQAAQAVTQRWAYSDLDAAKGWVDSLPQDTKTGAAESVASRLGQTDPQEGARWVNSLGDAPEFDGARTQFARQAVRRDPEQALSVISQISDKRRQEGYYKWAIGEWAGKDKGAAVEYISKNSAQMPESITKRYLKK